MREPITGAGLHLKITDVQATASSVRFVLAFSHATPSAKLGLNEVFINALPSPFADLATFEFSTLFFKPY